MTPVEADYLIETRLKRTSQFEGTIAKNENIWKLKHDTKFNLTRMWTSLRKRYNVEIEAYRSYYYACNKE
ncbi:hypothetical protein CYMTET_36159 [Cymbomonas tetramitiformis]|uniref:Uncharacterized protein n=1 Tax=Cymbomonas tetramitiformis TaxID=36881 RepID=A0AAE0CHW6_9CHLO|nr:hypothetical protein CYMTET_36159 [Cymbomonas tetramitiformis]